MSNRSRLPSGVRRALRGIMNGLAISNGNVSVGRDFNAGRGAIVSAPHRLNIGDNVSVGPRTVIQVDGSIGSHVMIGMNVYIVGREDHAINEVVFRCSRRRGWGTVSLVPAILSKLEQMYG